MLKDRRVWILAAYLFMAVYLLPMFPHGGSANEFTRWATAASLIEKGSFEISWTEPLLGPNVDTAKFGDRTYSNKAPMPAIVAAPIYALVRIFVGEPDASNIRISWFAMRLVIGTLPLLLLGIWMYRRGADEFALATLLFATPLFVYSLVLFSHVLVAVALYAAFRLLFDDKEPPTRDLVLAGLLCGFAVLSEFPAVVAAGAFGIGLILKGLPQGLRRVLWFAAGGIPFLVFLLVYNNALFGTPFSLSYAHESFPEWAGVAAQGYYGIGVPTPWNAYLLLLSPSRGILFSSPVLMLSVAAFWQEFDRRNVRSMVRLATILLTVLMICGHGAAHGSWAFGARYLVLILPLLVDPLIERETQEISPVLKGALLAISILLCAVPALTFPLAPPEFMFPHNDFWMSLIRGEGWFVPNISNLFGVPSTVWTLLPVMVCVALVFAGVAAANKARNRLAAGLLGGIAIVGTYMLWPGLANRGDNVVRRAWIAERFFRPSGRLDTLAADAARRSDWKALQNIRVLEWNTADARANAPDDWPYAPVTPLGHSPTATMRDAVALQQQERTDEAAGLFASGKELFPFGRCEFATNLATVYFTTDRKDAALAELEAIQPLVDRGSRPGCMRSQFMLGSLYKEIGRDADAETAFTNFLANSANTRDPDLLDLRKMLSAKK